MAQNSSIFSLGNEDYGTTTFIGPGFFAVWLG
jgi:hypothetical protein